jgi:hypothetical protein
MVHFKDKIVNHCLAILTQILVKLIVTLRLWKRKSKKSERGSDESFNIEDYEDIEEKFRFIVQSGK